MHAKKRGVDIGIIRIVMTSDTIADVFKVNLKGPGSLNVKKRISAFRLNKGAFFFEGANATKIWYLRSPSRYN
jgi:hypothetical protein